MRISAAVLSRCSEDEGPYLNGFVAHYSQLNFDKIYLVNTGESSNYILECVNPNYHSSIEILDYSADIPNWQESLLKWVMKYLNEDWILNVDIDEFLCIREGCIHQYLSRLDSRIEKVRFKWLLCVSDRYFHESISDMNFLPVHVSSQFKSMVKNAATVRLGVHDSVTMNPTEWIDESLDDGSGFVMHYACRGFLDLINRIVGRNYGNVKTGQIQEDLLRKLFYRHPTTLSDLPFRFNLYRVTRSLPLSSISVARLPYGEYLETDTILLREVTKSKLKKLNLDEQFFDSDSCLEQMIENRVGLANILLEHEVPSMIGHSYICGELSLTNATLTYIDKYDEHYLS